MHYGARRHGVCHIVVPDAVAIVRNLRDKEIQNERQRDTEKEQG